MPVFCSWTNNNNIIAAFKFTKDDVITIYEFD
jgi:hypothetical protein